jgi:hypothetical protein
MAPVCTRRSSSCLTQAVGVSGLERVPIIDSLIVVSSFILLAFCNYDNHDKDYYYYYYYYYCYYYYYYYYYCHHHHHQ